MEDWKNQMTGWEARLQEERNALQDKIVKLDDFLVYKKTVTGTDNLVLLEQQLCHMIAYRDVLDKRLAIIGRPPQPWLSIESAPTDGTEVMLYQNGAIDWGYFGFVEYDDVTREPIYDWLSDSDKIDFPTHWMPALPKPATPVR